PGSIPGFGRNLAGFWTHIATIMSALVSDTDIEIDWDLSVGVFLPHIHGNDMFLLLDPYPSSDDGMISCLPSKSFHSILMFYHFPYWSGKHTLVPDSVTFSQVTMRKIDGSSLFLEINVLKIHCCKDDIF
ncbi:hypothetical protein ACKJSM_28705, partial [Pseudomonas sp. PHC1]|uniref:hypothetical protein n=1 Tax=Pseudomonas sp. PHC1 TaxID=3384759 RepID=UPI00396F5B19